MPSVSEIPGFLHKVRHPRRSRSVSLGPQSAADAHEALALRREMRSEKQASASGTATGADTALPNGGTTLGAEKTATYFDSQPTTNSLSNPTSNSNEQIINLEEPLKTPPLETLSESLPTSTRSVSQDRRENEKEEREIFSAITRPRVRYDVEVITKLIVYSGKSLSHWSYSVLLTYSCRHRMD